MAKRRLNQYRGLLSAGEIAAGMNAARENSVRLHKAASALLDLADYPTALSLAALSIEESGKLSVLRGLALAKDEKEVKSAWRDYRTHTSKNRLWPIVEYFLKGAGKLNDFRSLFDDDAEHTQLLDQLKQIGFYTDCLGDKHWSLPWEVIDEPLAGAIVQISKILLPRNEVAVREIELWKECMGPVWMSRAEHMEAGLAKWGRMMVEEGLSENDAEWMDRFITHGVFSERGPNEQCGAEE